MQEPWIHAREARNFAHAHAALECKTDVAQALGSRRDQHLRQAARLQDFGAGPLAGFKRAPRLHQRFFEGAAHGHHFADRFHLRPERVVGAGKFFELPLGDLDDHVVDGGLEAGRRLARDVVGNLVERVTHGELGGDLRDRKAGSLRSQRRRTRHARVHLDHDHAAVGGIDGELHIRSAGLHADLAHHGDRCVAHLLVLAIGERLRGRDGDGVAGMHAHGIEILNRADDDDVVGEVAHHLELVFLPAENALFNQALVDRRKIEAARQNLHQLFAVVGDAAAGAAQRKARPDQHRKTDLAGEIQAVAKIVHQRRLGNIEADANHRVFEEQTVFGLLDGLELGADQLDVVAIENAGVGEIDGEIERRLSADCGEQRELAGAGDRASRFRCG